MEELALPTRGIQLSGEVLSTDEAASAELHEAEAVHWTRNSCRLFKAAPMTPCICQEQQLETGLSNKCLKRTLELLLHCGGPAKPRLLRTVVPHTAAVVWMGTTGTRPAHNSIKLTLFWEHKSRLTHGGATAGANRGTQHTRSES